MSTAKRSAAACWTATAALATYGVTDANRIVQRAHAVDSVIYGIWVMPLFWLVAGVWCWSGAGDRLGFPTEDKDNQL